MTERRVYYRRDGTPIMDVMEWGRLHNDYDYKVVAKNNDGDCEVSTVWLGIDHGFGHTLAPLIFETMVFCKDENDERHEQMWRYATEAEARAGHAEIASVYLRHTIDLPLPD